MSVARISILLLAVSGALAMPKPDAIPVVVETITQYTTICDTEVSSAIPYVPPSPQTSSKSEAATTKATSAHAVPEPSYAPAPGPAPAPSVAPAPVPAPSVIPVPPTKGGGSGKRGLVMDAGSANVVAAFAAYPKITWLMNWWSGPQGTMNQSWSFFPMMTHPTPDQYWANNVVKAKAEGWKYLGHILEPDDNKVTVAQGVASWKQYMEPHANDFILVPPVVNDMSWLTQFFAACTGCSLSKSPIAFNMYVSGDDAGIKFFKDHVESTAALFPGRDLWVPNAAILGGSNGTDEYLMTNILPWLDAQPAVKRYAWNGPGGPTGEFWDGTSLTATGKIWATL